MIVDPEKEKSYCLTKQDAILRKDSVSEIKYSVEIDLNEFDFEGTCKIEFLYHGGKIWLDLNNAEIFSIVLNSNAVELTYLRSKVYLPELALGRTEIIVSYRRTYSKDGYGLHYFKDLDDCTYIYSNFEPFHCHKMIPCFDQPDLKATFLLSVKGPSSFKVLSNSAIASVHEISPNRSLTHFKETLKISTYLFALIAGDYHEVRLDQNHLNIPLGLYCRKSLQSQLVPERYFSWTLKGFVFFQDMFGIPYPFFKYDQIFVPEYNSGAMENVGCVTFREDYLVTKNFSSDLCYAATTFLHEMSHMWFGNLVTMKWWDDLWLNESFATYLSYLAVDHCLSSEFHESWMLFLRRKTFAYSADQKKTTHPISSHVENSSQTRSMFDSISYSKGAAVIKQLVFLIGFDHFKAGLSEYLKENAFGNTEFLDLISVFEKRNPDLKEWAQTWIKTSGVNLLKATCNDGVIEISQEVLPNCDCIKPHFLYVETFDGNGESIEKLKVLVNQEKNLVDIKNKPQFIIVNSDDEAYCKVHIDEISLNYFRQSMFNVKSPVNRMLIFNQINEMVNDLVFSPIDFLNLIVSHLQFEPEPTIFSYLLGLAFSTIVNKIEKKSIKVNFYTIFFDIVLNHLQKFPEISEFLFSFLYTDEQILASVKWLTEGSPIELTQARRWKILKLYSRISVNAKEIVDKEIDNTSDGILARLYCESVIPDLENKEKIWEKFVQGCPGLSRFQRKSAMSGFMKKSQKNILKKFAKLYFQEAETICDRFEFEYALDFCTLLFPVFKSEKYLKKKTEKLLEIIKPENLQLIKMYKNQIEIIEKNNKIKKRNQEEKNENEKKDNEKKIEDNEEKNKINELNCEEFNNVLELEEGLKGKNEEIDTIGKDLEKIKTENKKEINNIIEESKAENRES